MLDGQHPCMNTQPIGRPQLPGDAPHTGITHTTRRPRTARGRVLLGGTLCLALMTGAVQLSAHASDSAPGTGSPVTVAVDGGVAAIDPATLAVTFTPAGGRPIVWSAPSPTALGTPTTAVSSDGTVSWGYADSDLRVTVSEQQGRLDTRLDSTTDRSITWPVTATDASARSIEFPNGEGRSVPVDDPFWWSDDAHLTGDPWNLTDNLSMPFWGTTLDGAGVSYIVHADTDIGTELDFAPHEDRLTASGIHDFNGVLDTSAYRVTMSATDGGPIAAAQDYRRLLLSQDGITTLDEKIRKNPENQKLIGAFHAYLWGAGDDPTLIDRLQELGIQDVWLGYNPDHDVMSADTVAAAAAAGYLTAPYDTWENAQDPATTDTVTSVWPGDIWPAACALDENGEPLGGFWGRGCTLSNAQMAIEEAERGVLSSRVQALSGNGVTSYFLDVDATGDLAHDHSPVHPQTKAEDRQYRIDRMGRLQDGAFSNGRPFVLGSEKAEWWANPVVSFSHGSSTVLSSGIWKLQQDREQWGNYWPAERPDFFFKPVDLPASLVKEMIDPRYRVPLYEAVLHDSIVSTDRWEMGLYKFAGQETTRILSNLLTNTPAMLALDHGVLDEHGQQLAEMTAFFRILQDAAGTAAMTSFERVGSNVQRTGFGADDTAPTLTVSVNFGDAEEAGVPAKCAVATVAGQTPVTYCPEASGS